MLYAFLAHGSPAQAATSNLSLSEALSGISGSISLVSWIVLLLPQLIENYKNGRADALSPAFLIAWFVGDVTNLLGAVWGGLLPTVIALAVYFTFADVILLTQTFYYNQITRRKKERRLSRWSRRAQSNEADPLLSSVSPRPSLAHRRVSTISRHRRSSAKRGDGLSGLLREKGNKYVAVFRNALAVVGVCVAGSLGWFIAWRTGAWSVQDETPGDREMPMGAVLMGYISAALYLSARIPQIWRNHKNQSCDGLSLLFFILSLLGNLSYGAGILFHSTEKTYVLDNLPWLMGSLGTMAEDCVIFAQFVIYSRRKALDTSAIS